MYYFKIQIFMIKSKLITELNVPNGNTNIFAFDIFGLNLVFISGFIRPVRFGLAGTDPVEISISAVTYKYYSYCVLLMNFKDLN